MGPYLDLAYSGVILNVHAFRIRGAYWGNVGSSLAWSAKRRVQRKVPGNLVVGLNAYNSPKGSNVVLFWVVYYNP